MKLGAYLAYIWKIEIREDLKWIRLIMNFGKRWEKLLKKNNIIVILENYKTLKQFTIQVENVKFSKEEIDQAKQKELEKMMEEVFSSKEIYLESVYKKHLQTKLFLNFLESTFKEYIKETEISMKPKSELKIAILSEVYMEGKEIKQFLYEHNLGYGRTFYYARNELYEELAVRVFGIYALKL